MMSLVSLTYLDCGPRATLEVERGVGLGVRRLTFETGSCHLELGDVDKSCYLSLIFPSCKMDMVVLELTIKSLGSYETACIIKNHIQRDCVYHTEPNRFLLFPFPPHLSSMSAA